MREGIGSVFLYNIIIVFIVITFGFLSASLSYMKAFKVNGKIANSLEKYEGYNELSDKEIAETLSTIGYRIVGEMECPSIKKFGVELTPVPEGINNTNKMHEYCLYEYKIKEGYFTYRIATYIHLDIPIIGGMFKLPVYSETEPIFKFGDGSSQQGVVNK